MLVYVPPTAKAVRIWGLHLSFNGGVAFPLHHEGIFALKRSAPSRVYHLGETSSTKSTVAEYVKRVMVVYTRSFDFFHVLICCFTSTLSSWCHVGTVSYLTTLSPVGSKLVSSAHSFDQL